MRTHPKDIERDMKKYKHARSLWGDIGVIEN